MRTVSSIYYLLLIVSPVIVIFTWGRYSSLASPRGPGSSCSSRTVCQRSGVNAVADQTKGAFEKETTGKVRSTSDSFIFQPERDSAEVPEGSFSTARHVVGRKPDSLSCNVNNRAVPFMPQAPTIAYIGGREGQVLPHFRVNRQQPFRSED